jgi:cellobiose-specific phosphotransferase system component IIA
MQRSFSSSGNRQLRSHVGDDVDVARVLRDVGDEDRLAVQRRVAYQPLTQPHSRHFHLLAVLDGELHFEIPALLVHEQDAEGAVVDDAARELRDAVEELIQRQHRRDLAADLRQRLERRRVEAAALEQPRVDDRHGDVRGELPQQHHVGRRELIAMPAQQVERADRPLLVQQRHDELRRHARGRRRRSVDRRRRR